MTMMSKVFHFSTTDEQPSSPRSIRPLSMASAGQELRLLEIRAGRRLSHRLAEMGLTPGATLRVVQDNGGPLLVSVRGSRIALGRGLAHKMMVEPVE